MPSLWVPQCRHDNTSDTAVHESWITRLVTGLLDSGGVSEQVLVLVKPVCQVKVSMYITYTSICLQCNISDTFEVEVHQIEKISIKV